MKGEIQVRMSVVSRVAFLRTRLFLAVLKAVGNRSELREVLIRVVRIVLIRTSFTANNCIHCPKCSSIHPSIT